MITIRSERPVSPEFEEFSNKGRFPALDGLRAIAALTVVVYHCPTLDHPILNRIQHTGDLGVDFFFVLSGFLVTTLTLRESPAPGPHRLRNFYLRRMLRIFPAYYLAILVFWGASSAFAASPKSQAFQSYLPYYLFYVPDLRLGWTRDPIFPPFGHAWSLGVEEKFYLLWPLFLIWLSEKRLLQVSIAFIAGACAWRFWLVASGEEAIAARLYYPMDTRFDALVWGGVLALILRRPRVFDLLRGLGSPVLFYVFVALFGIVALEFNNESQIRYVAAPALALAIIALMVVRPTLTGVGLLDAAPFRHIGLVSYGIYIYHTLVLSVLLLVMPADTLFHQFGLMGAVVCGAVVVGTVSYFAFERWFLRLRRRFRDGSRQASSSSRE